MTELLYQQDSYLKECRAKVIQVDMENYTVIADKSVLYPAGGGQPADNGILRFQGKSSMVINVKKRDEVVIFFINPQDSFPRPGTEIEEIVDWDRRYQLMRTHTAMHILCGVIFRDYGATVTGGDMELLQGRMDFEFETMHKDLVQDIETAVNKEIDAARQVRIKILPRDEAFQIPDLIRTKINLLPPDIERVRTVEIIGLDLQADGGTHVNNTQEVGHIRVVDYKSKGKINKRIYIEVT